MSDVPLMPGREPTAESDRPYAAPPHSSPPRRRIWPWLAGLAALLAIGGGGAFVLFGRGSTDDGGERQVVGAPVPAETPSPTPTPTPSVEPIANGKLGKAVKLDELTATVYRYKKLNEEFDGELAGTKAGAVDIKVCNTSPAAFEVGGAPWSLLFADDTVSEEQWSGMASPQYPINGKKLNPGRCVRGWISFTLSNGQKPTAVEYAPGTEEDNLPTVTWRIS